MTDITNYYEMSFEELAALKEGTIIDDWFEDGVRCMIMRGPFSLCAYFGIPLDHPLAGKEYDAVPLDCHGGLTFSRAGDGHYYPSGYWWYGWDYGQSRDKCFYNLLSRRSNNDEREWLAKEVRDEMRMSLHDFVKLMKLVEDK